MSASLTLFQHALWLTLLMSAPVLIVAIVVGVVVSLVQALMQLQDQTLPFAIKLVLVGLTLMLTGPWAGIQLIQLSHQVLDMIATRGHY